MDKTNKMENEAFEEIFHDPEFDSEYCKRVFTSLENRGTACDNKTFGVNKEYLMKRSKYFGIFCGNNFREVHCHVLNCNLNYNLTPIIKYYFEGEIRITNDNVYDIYYLSARLTIIPLENFCKRFIMKLLNYETFQFGYQKARDCDLPDIVECTADYVEVHFVEFINHPAMMRWSFELMTDVLSSDKLQVSSETKVLQMVYNWLKYDFNNRKHHMDDLLKKIRFAYLTTDSIEKSFTDEVSEFKSLCLDYKKNHMTLKTSESTNAEAERFYLKGFYIFYSDEGPTWNKEYMLRWYIDENIVKVWYDPTIAEIPCSGCDESFGENQFSNFSSPYNLCFRNVEDRQLDGDNFQIFLMIYDLKEKTRLFSKKVNLNRFAIRHVTWCTFEEKYMFLKLQIINRFALRFIIRMQMTGKFLM